MRSDDIARLMVAGMNPSTNGDLGFHQGVVTAWDEATGSNSVMVNGNTFTNLRVLSTSDSIFLATGDTVGLLRFQSTYFILGRIAAPGGGAGLKVRSAKVATSENTAIASFGDLPSIGPQITNVYIGSSRKCLVLVKALISANSSRGDMSFDVTGASSITAASLGTEAAIFQSPAIGGVSPGASVTSPVLLTAAEGLQQGFNTFTAKYKVTLQDGGTGAQFLNRSLTVFPL